MYWLKTNAISQNMIQRYLSLPNLAAAKRFVQKGSVGVWESPLINNDFASYFSVRVLHINTLAEHFGSLSLACLFC